MKTILFIVDIKSRDLPSISLIGYFLKKKYKVVYGRANELEKYINKKFDCVILPKINRFDESFKYFVYEAIRKKKFLICSENEGNINVKIKKKFLIMPHLFIFWGRNQFKMYKKLFLRNNNYKILGNPRLDFFHKKMNSLLIDKSKYLKKNKIKNRFCLTFTTRTQEAHKSLSLISKIRKRRKEMYYEPKNYFIDYVNSSKKMLKNTSELLTKLNERFPNINLLVKPHPNENLQFWHYLEDKLDNLKIIKDLTLENFLKLSDLNISQNICSSTFEAQLMSIRTIEMQTNFVKKYSLKIHQKLADYVVFDSNKILTILSEIISKNKKNLLNKKKKKYINNFFHKFDGERCRNYAKQIDEFFSISLKKNSNFNLNRNQLKQLQFLKDKFRKKKNNNEKFGLKKMIKFFLPTSKKNLKYDNKFRYDHRYNSNDEKIWYKKFDKLYLKDI